MLHRARIHVHSTLNLREISSRGEASHGVTLRNFYATSSADITEYDDDDDDDATVEKHERRKKVPFVSTPVFVYYDL